MFERLADHDFAYLTTFGRRTGKAHTVEIWFGLDDRRVYMLSGGGDRADWVRNLRKTPRVRVRVGTRPYYQKDGNENDQVGVGICRCWPA